MDHWLNTARTNSSRTDSVVNDSAHSAGDGDNLRERRTVGFNGRLGADREVGGIGRGGGFLFSAFLVEHEPCGRNADGNAKYAYRE